MDDQPPRFPGPPEEEPLEEPFPQFEPYPSGGEPARAMGAQPYHGGGQANPWLVGLAVAAVLIAISVIAFGLFAPEETAAGTTVPTEGTDTSLDGTETTGPADDGTGTTAPVDDSTGTTTTTAGSAEITIPGDDGPLEITPVGDPIPVADLTMSSNDIGPLDFGDDGNEVLGKLAATFGAPTQDTGFLVGNGSFGECPGDSIRVVQWGPLNVILIGEPGASTFESYRSDLRYGDLTSPTRDLATLSGLRVGDTVGQLEDIYGGFVIEYVVDENVGLVFELRSQRGGEILLWGPVESQEAESLVTGIYAPDACQS